jgi:hypothetical protein
MADAPLSSSAAGAPPPPDPAAAAELAALLDPKGAFIEDVPAYLSARKLEPEAAILDLQERMRRLRALEGQVAGRRARTLAKVPEIEAALASANGLAARRRGAPPGGGGGKDADAGKDAGGDGGETAAAAADDAAAAHVTHVDYALADGVFARAALRGDVRAVGLWLGAGVMVEYPLDEARRLLEGNLVAARETLAALGRDLDRVKDGLTVTEVSIARVFNYDVERRRRAKGAAAGGTGAGAGAASAAQVAA